MLTIIPDKIKTTIGLVLTAINLINYMDRQSILAISESHLKCQFRLSDDDMGSLLTVFYLCYMLISPIIGYLGDTYSRKRIISVGVFIWLISLYLSSFIPTPDICTSQEDVNFYWRLLLLSRALFGIGEACYVCVATAILHDMHLTDSKRMLWIITFSVAIPIGAGVGYMTGDYFANQPGNDWQDAIKSNSMPLAVLLIFWLLLPDVPHGYSDFVNLYQNKNETGESYILKIQTNPISKKNLDREFTHFQKNNRKSISWNDLKKSLISLYHNKTYVATCLGSTLTYFGLGAGTIYLPILLQRSQNLTRNQKIMEAADLVTENSAIEVRSDVISYSDLTENCSNPTDYRGVRIIWGHLNFPIFIAIFMEFSPKLYDGY